MTNYSSPFLEEKEIQIHSDSSYILLLVDSSLVKFHIKKILKGTVFSYSSEVESSIDKAFGLQPCLL